MVEGYRQEVINVALARLLQEGGLITAPEYMLNATPERGRRFVDVIVNYNGLRTAIEGELADQPGAAERALGAARRRVEEGVAHIGIAVVYPEHLRQSDFKHLQAELADSQLQIALVTEAEETGFAQADVDYLRTALQRAFERLVREDAVGRAVAILDAGVERFASAFSVKPGVLGRLISSLGIKALTVRDVSPDEEE